MCTLVTAVRLCCCPALSSRSSPSAPVSAYPPVRVSAYPPVRVSVPRFVAAAHARSTPAERTLVVLDAAAFASTARNPRFVAPAEQTDMTRMQLSLSLYCARTKGGTSGSRASPVRPCSLSNSSQ